MRRESSFLLTKIIATVGPSCSSPDVIEKCILNGVRIFRINFSHGSFDEYTYFVKQIRNVSAKLNIQVGIMGDLSGPKIRIGKVAGEGVKLEKGQKVKFVSADVVTGEEQDDIVFSTNYNNLVSEVEPGETLLLDDGSIKLTCTEKNDAEKYFVCRVENRGVITSNKGLNLPETDLSIPALTEKDYKCVEFSVEHEFDFLALSFVKSADDVKLLKSFLRKIGGRPGKYIVKDDNKKYVSLPENKSFIPVISKIEKPQAVKDLDNILEETDAVMIARGDLGVEMDLAELAVTQKIIVSKCYDYGIPVIVATQMLQSMISSPNPTRAEVSDVANAIFDGADAVMLSGETSIGKYSVDAVAMMRRIAKKTNDYLCEIKLEEKAPAKLGFSKKLSPALASGVKTILNETDSKLIVVWTQTDGIPVFLSKHHLKKPIIACSSFDAIVRRLTLLYGIYPLKMKEPKNSSDFIDKIKKMILKNNWAEKGESIIFLFGERFGSEGAADQIQIKYL